MQIMGTDQPPTAPAKYPTEQTPSETSSDGTEEPSHGSWRSRVRWAALGTLPLCAAAVAVAWFSVASYCQELARPARSTAPTPIATPTPPSPASSAQDPDVMFGLLDGIRIPYPNRAYVISRAKRICELYASPDEPSTVAINRRIVHESMWDAVEASKMIAAATELYCPQFRGWHQPPPAAASQPTLDQLFTEYAQSDGVYAAGLLPTTGRAACEWARVNPTAPFGALMKHTAAVTELDDSTAVYIASDASRLYCPQS
jgi:hypothetical protein